MSKALIFGGGGQIGIATAVVFADSGWAVTIVARHARGAVDDLKNRGIDVLDGAGRTRTEVIADLGPHDAIIDPTAYNLEDAAELLASQRRTGALVVVSSSSVYADSQGRSLDETSQLGFPDFPEPISEDTPTVEPGPATYSTRKVAMEHALREAEIPVTILRPCAVYGRYARHLREWWFIKRAIDGRKRIPLAFDGKSVFHTSSTSGIASLIEHALRNPRHTVLNVADTTAVSVRDIGLAIERAIDRPVAMYPFAGEPVGQKGVGDSPWSTPQPYVIDTSRARALGWTGGIYADAVADTCRWAIEAAERNEWQDVFTLQQIYGPHVFDYDAEDQFLAAL